MRKYLAGAAVLAGLMAAPAQAETYGVWDVYQDSKGCSLMTALHRANGSLAGVATVAPIMTKAGPAVLLGLTMRPGVFNRPVGVARITIGGYTAMLPMAAGDPGADYQGVLGAVPDPAVFLDRYAAGSRMDVRLADGMTVTLHLAGSGAAVRALPACWRRVEQDAVSGGGQPIPAPTPGRWS